MPLTNLANGMRFASIRHSGQTVNAISLSVRAGSASESENGRGAAHFLEHLTLARSSGASRTGLASAFDRLGAGPTALTGKESTSYSVRVRGEDLLAALGAFRGVLVQPDTTGSRVEAERKTVLAELAAIRQDIERMAILKAESTLFEGTELARVPIGTSDDIRNLGGEALEEYWSSNYLPANVDILVVGPTRHRELLPKICEIFGTEPMVSPVKPIASRLPEVSRLGSVAVVGPAENASVAPVVVAFPAPSAGDDSRVHAVVLASLLGSGFGSLLVSELRVERQLVYSPRAFYTGYRARGLLTISAPTRPDSTGEVFARTREIMNRIASGDFSRRQLEYAIRHVSCATEVAHADQTGLLRALASSTQYLDREPALDELIRMVEAVSAYNIAATASAMLRNELKVVPID